jgi:O-methyltransferase involved in polyketide biosynthesis
VIELRRRFIQESQRRRFVGMSVLDPKWLDLAADLCQQRKLLFVAEGVLYWLGEENVQILFRRLADRFPGTAIVFDTQSPMFVRYTHWRVRGFQQAKIRWSIANVARIEQWDKRLKVEKNIQFGDSPHYDNVLKRLPYYMQLAPKLFPPSRRFFQVSSVRFHGRDG